MAIEGSVLPVDGYDSGRNTLQFPLLARGGETGAIYLMLEPRVGICLIADSRHQIKVGSKQTAGTFIPLNVAESVVLTQVFGEQQ